MQTGPANEKPSMADAKEPKNQNIQEKLADLRPEPHTLMRAERERKISPHSFLNTSCNSQTRNKPLANRKFDEKQRYEGS